MITINTREAETSIKRKMDQISNRNVVVANTRAINAALMKARTAFRKEARKQYNVTADTLKLIDIKKATYSTVQGEVFAVSNPISLSRFNPKFETSQGTASVKEVTVFDINSKKKKRQLTQSFTGTGKKDPAKGVSIEVKKGERKRLPFAFMVAGATGGVSLQVWARGTYKGGSFETARPRLPITPLKTTSPFSIIKNEAVMKPVSEKAKQDYQQEMQRQVEVMASQR